MLSVLARPVARWGKRLTFRWSLRAQMLVPVLCAELGLLITAGSICIAVAQHESGQLPGGEQIVELSTTYYLLSLVLVFVTVTGIVWMSVRALVRNLTEISEGVEQQLASGALDIEVKSSRARHDEIGRLISALNELGLAYRTSLQNLARQTDERAVLDLLAATINRTLDLQEVLDTSLRGTLKAVKWDMGAVYMWDDRDSSLNMVSFIGLSEDVVRRNITHRLDDGVIGKSAQARVVLIDRLSEWSPGGASGVPAVQISVPLVTVPGQLLGVMAIGSSQPKIPTQGELSLLKTVASHISLAIDKAQLYTKVSQHAVELEKLVTARTEQLSQAIDELWTALKQAQEADRVKSLLLSTVSHELRTPLATIKGNTSLLIQHHGDIPPDLFIEHLQDIDEETDKLTELISNLLDMSRLEAGMLLIQVRAINLLDILKAAVAAARLRLQRHTIRLKCSASSAIAYGDARRVEQIVANLLDNAAKYSPAATTIDVTVKSGGDEMIVSVKDRGRGIETEHLDRIFERFYQVGPGRDSGRYGIGLGLAICRGLVEAQGGRIWVESRVGRGSTFYFSLPTVGRDTLQEDE
jgi:K+-sensing histidine kinase KdpD